MGEGTAFPPSALLPLPLLLPPPLADRFIDEKMPESQPTPKKAEPFSRAFGAAAALALALLFLLVVLEVDVEVFDDVDAD